MILELYERHVGCWINVLPLQTVGVNPDAGQ